MQQKIAHKQEKRLAKKKQVKFRETAQVRLEVLHFFNTKTRKLDQEKIKLLKFCFQSEDCNRYSCKNHVLKVIAQQDLQKATKNIEESSVILLSNVQNE